MNIQTRLIVVLVAATGIVALLGLAISYQLGVINEQTDASMALSDRLPERFETLSHASHLDKLALSIKYYDEVLTQSARNYAFTGDAQWELRYRTAEPELDAVIKEAISEGGETEKLFFDTVNDANQALVVMEYDSIELVNQGMSAEAIKILNSDWYWQNKAIYSNALEQYISSRGNEYYMRSDEVVETITESNSLGATNAKLLADLNILMFILVPASIAIVFIAGIKLSRSIIGPIKSLIRATDELARGNYEADLGKIRTDETGLLASRFDQMRRELQEKDRNRDDFIKIASHELRTPIQPIIAYVELARKNIVGKEKALAEIEVQAKRLVRLSADLLDVAKSDNGTLTYKMERININDMITAAASASQARLRGTDRVVLQSNCNETIGLDVRADAVRMSQVLTNILNNAIKFTDKGRIAILTKYDSSRNEVTVEIADSGKGISKEIMPRLFEKFASSSSTDGNAEGTGLGLHLAAKIIDAHKGRIWGKNNGLGGATFGFSLPAMAIEEDEAALVPEICEHRPNINNKRRHSI